MCFITVIFIINKSRVQNIIKPKITVINRSIHVINSIWLEFTTSWVTLLNSGLHYVLVSQWVLNCVQIDHVAITFWMSDLYANSASECLKYIIEGLLCGISSRSVTLDRSGTHRMASLTHRRILMDVPVYVLIFGRVRTQHTGILKHP